MRIDETTLFGILAVLLGFFSLQMDKRKNIMMCLFASSGAFCLHYLLNGESLIAGFAINVVCAVRNIVYSNTTYSQKRNKFLRSRVIPGIFSVMLIGVCVFMWHGLTTVLLIVGHVVATFGFHLRKTNHMRIGVLISSPLLLAHEILNLSFGGVASEFVMIVSAVIGLVRMRGHNHGR